MVIISTKHNHVTAPPDQPPPATISARLDHGFRFRYETRPDEMAQCDRSAFRCSRSQGLEQKVNSISMIPGYSGVYSPRRHRKSPPVKIRVLLSPRAQSDLELLSSKEQIYLKIKIEGPFLPPTSGCGPYRCLLDTTCQTIAFI